MTEPKAQLVAGEPIDVYLSKTDHWSHSMFEDARGSLERAHATHVLGEVKKEVSSRTQDVFDFGNATHAATLEPNEFGSRWLRGPTNDRRSAKWREAALDVPEGAKLLQPSVFDKVEVMAARVRCHPIVGPVLERPGIAEGSIYWRDDETGLQRRARPDYAIPPSMDFAGAVLELKTYGGDPNPEALGKTFVNLGYHRKQANDVEAYTALYGVPPGVYVFAFVSKVPPHEVAAFVLDDGSAELGEEQRRRDVRRVAEAIERGSFAQPWNTDVSTLVLPAYAHFAD